MYHIPINRFLSITSCLVATAAADKADELGFNLFTDLAP